MGNPITGAKLILLTISLSLGIFMNVLDSSIANVAIPYIAGGLAVSPDQGTWVITSFTVSTAIMLPLTGWLAKQFGEVRLFVLSTLIFTILSFMCGLARNLPEIVLFRVLQGMAAGPMIPLSQSILLQNYPEEKKGVANSLWAMTAVVAPLCGPILGGWLTYDYSWPWIFYINVPVGLFCCFMTHKLLKDRDTQIIKAPIDYVGMLLLAIGVGCLQLLLDNGQDFDWFHSDIIITLAIISFVSLSYFLVWELTERYPIVDLSLFKVRNFRIGTIAISLGYMTFFSNVVIMPLWLQTQMGYTAIWAGFAIAPMGLIPVILTLYVGENIKKINLRLMISFGFAVFAITSFWSAFFDTSVSFNALFWPRFFMGLGIVCFFNPLLKVIK
ncbi:MAG: DHA2 family efflux MFS transporter permease subunit, partial [Gammaproteobacteria bacterium]